MRHMGRKIIGAVAALLLLVRAAGAEEADPARIVIGGGMPFGFSFGAAGAACAAWNAPESETPCYAVANQDSAGNLAALESGAVDFAFVQSDWLRHAVDGTSRFRAEGANDELRAVFSLPGEALTVLARRDLGAESIKHADGRRIGFGAPRSYAYLLMSVAARAAGVDLAGPNGALNGVARDDATALCDGDLDVLATVAAHPSGTVAGLMGRCGLDLLTVDARTAKTVLRKHPDFAELVIPAGVYGPEQPEIRTFGLRTVLVALQGTPEKTVRALARAVFANLDMLRKGHPGLGDLAPEDMIAGGIAAPLHEGAVKLYEEKDWR